MSVLDLCKPALQGHFLIFTAQQQFESVSLDDILENADLKQIFKDIVDDDLIELMRTKWFLPIHTHSSMSGWESAVR